MDDPDLKDMDTKDIDLDKIFRTPTKEKMTVTHDEFADRKIPIVHAESSMSYWWPQVKDLDVPQPRTICILVNEQAMIQVIDGAPIPNLDKMQQAVMKIGSPTFVRNNITSGKHGWKDTCYLKNPDDLPAHVYQSIESALMTSMGETKMDALFFREFLDLEPVGFSCFYGNMPISKEVRCFVRDGMLECMHPYWFAEVFERELEMHDNLCERRKNIGMDNSDMAEILPHDWRDRLDKINKLTTDDTDTIISHLSKITPHFDGYWSVDFTKGTNGKWYLIDMARGEVSFHMESCKNNPGMTC